MRFHGFVARTAAASALALGLTVAFAVMLLGIGLMGSGHGDTGRTVALSGFSLVFLAQALAQLTTRYSWKNLAKGNRGPSRAESPSRYWAAVGADIVLFIGISGYAGWQWLR